MTSATPPRLPHLGERLRLQHAPGCPRAPAPAAAPSSGRAGPRDRVSGGRREGRGRTGTGVRAKVGSRGQVGFAHDRAGAPGRPAARPSRAQNSSAPLTWVIGKTWREAAQTVSSAWIGVSSAE
ncbi:hypothetical protein TBS_24630 [Thermobispora bispora]